MRKATNGAQPLLEAEPVDVIPADDIDRYRRELAALVLSRIWRISHSVLVPPGAMMIAAERAIVLVSRIARLLKIRPSVTISRVSGLSTTAQDGFAGWIQ